MGIGRRIIELAKPMVERFPTLAMAYRAWRDSRAMMSEARMTPLGFRFCGNRHMEEGTFEADEVAIVKEYLKKSEVMINVGANIGYYCCLALSHGVKTIAFEPIESNLKYLYRNIRANAWDNIEIFPIALSNRTGLIDIYGGGTGASLIEGWAGLSKESCRLVPVSTLDRVLGTRLSGRRSLFVIDIEGAERYMLEGAIAQLTLVPRPVWMVEISINEHQPHGNAINPHLLATFDIFWDAGYEAWTADQRMLPVTREGVNRICESGEDTLHAHNFLFAQGHARPIPQEAGSQPWTVKCT